jgi:hypothetical protein
MKFHKPYSANSITAHRPTVDYSTQLIKPYVKTIVSYSREIDDDMFYLAQAIL